MGIFSHFAEFRGCTDPFPWFPKHFCGKVKSSLKNNQKLSYLIAHSHLVQKHKQSFNWQEASFDD